MSTTTIRRTAALAVTDLTAGYGRTTVLRDVSLEVGAGTVVALLGPNGAGKTTLLRAAAGVVRPTAGTVRLGGTDVTGRRPHQRSRDGLCLVPEGRGIFPNLSVRENLALQTRPADAEDGLERVLDAFPDLRNRLRQQAGSLSGGQQQMVALGRCFSSSPKVVLLDEVSMGLAPLVIDQIFEALTRLAATGVALLLVEQYVSRALDMADTVYLLDRGRIDFAGAPGELDEDDIMRRYLSVAAPTEGNRS